MAQADIEILDRLLVADKSGLLWAACCEGAGIARDVSETEANCITWFCHVQNLIVENAPPGVLLVYEEVDIKEDVFHVLSSQGIG